jgi:hypothetical protein
MDPAAAGQRAAEFRVAGVMAVRGSTSNRRDPGGDRGQRFRGLWRGVRGGVAYAAHRDMWAFPASLAAVASMALIVATFTPWWSFAVVINAAILYAAWQSATAQPAG